MEKTILFIAYNERWNASNKYLDHEVKIVIMQRDKKYEDLVEKTYKELRLDQKLTSIQISFDAKIETSKGMKIESDENVEVYVKLSHSIDEFKNCPLVVKFFIILLPSIHVF